MAVIASVPARAWIHGSGQDKSITIDPLMHPLR
jgi:hypothetical protein